MGIDPTVRAFSVIVKTDCANDGSYFSTSCILQPRVLESPQSSHSSRATHGAAALQIATSSVLTCIELTC